MADPREALEEVCLTSDSEDELADLEKEFALRKQKLLEERARKKAKRAHVDVTRSPSPPRRQDPQTEYFQRLNVEHEAKRPKPTEKKEIQPKGLFATQTKQRPAVKPNVSSSFASRLVGIEGNAPGGGNLNERVFEFEDVPKVKMEPAAEDEKDEYTGLELVSRMAPLNTVRHYLKEIKVLGIRKLLAKVVSPKFEEPAYVNWCLVGMVVYKGQPKHTVNGQKYLQLRIGDFTHSVALMLFGGAFERYWKLRPGEIVAVLNPRVKRFQGSFGLNLSEDLHSILEIGAARNFGYCSSGKDGVKCKHVVDISKTQLCEYHEEHKYRAPASRMELQGSVKMKGPGEGGNGMGARRGTNYGSHWETAQAQALGLQGPERNDVFYGGSGFDGSKFDKPMATDKKKEARRAASNQRLEQRLRASVAPARAQQLQKLGILRDNISHSGTPVATVESPAQGRQCGSKLQHRPGNDEQRGRNEGGQRKENEGEQSIKPSSRAAQDQSAVFPERPSGLRKLAATMGFDPTARSTPSTGARAQWAQELQELSRQKKVSLAPADDEKRKKVALWRKNASLVAGAPGHQKVTAQLPQQPASVARPNSAGTKRPVEANTGENAKSKNISNAENGVAAPPPDRFDDDDDDDLEIDFATTAQHQGYCGLVQGGEENT